MSATPDGSGDALESSAHELHLDGSHQAALAAFERAHAAYRRDGDVLGAARTARTVGWLRGWIHGEWVVHDAWMRRAADLLDADGASPRSRGWRLLDEARQGSDLAEQRVRYEEAVAIGRSYDDPDLECDATASLGMMLVFSGMVDEGMRHLDAALAAICAGDVVELPVVEGCLCGLFNACERLGDVRRAEEWLRAGGDVMRQRRLMAVAGYCRAHYAGLLVAAGRWAEAEAELEEALAELPDGLPVQDHARCRLADLRLRQGRLDDAERLLAGCSAHEDALRPQVRLHLLRGRTPEAKALLAAGLAEPAEDHHQIPLRILAAEVALAEGDIAGAQAQAQAALTAAERQASTYLRGCARLASGKVTAELNGDAAPILRAAISDFRAAAHPYEEALARLELASSFEAADGGSAAARMEVGQAIATFEQLGARADADRAAAAARRLGGGTAPGPREAEALTRREREVLDLLAHGLTNAEIAARLFISQKTAEHHVSRILAKLGVRNRAEAAVHALRRGAPS